MYDWPDSTPGITQSREWGGGGGGGWTCVIPGVESGQSYIHVHVCMTGLTQLQESHKAGSGEGGGGQGQSVT